MGTKLYVGNIAFQASEDDLRELFLKAGEVASAKLIKDVATGRPRGFGFVEMGSESDAQKAISMFNGSSFMERSIVVNEAKPQERKDRGSSRGGFREKSGGFGARRDRGDRGRR